MTQKEIETYEEVRREIIQHKELEIVKTATLNDINIDALNQYITQFNIGKIRTKQITRSTRRMNTH